MTFKFSLALIALFFIKINAQKTPKASIISQDQLLIKEQFQQRSLVKNVPFKNIGPTVMSGRVTDLEVNPENPLEFYVGYASGGVWHTVNNGVTFAPILDSSQTQNVGDIAVDWKSRTIWVGTGENNSSRSSYSGIGLLKSKDNGKTWVFSGLPDSHHIGRILINPNNVNELVVGVTGNLYSLNDERGIYKTKDGGQTWKKTLFVDNTSGIIDLQHAPNNFNTMFAASWTKDRKAWHFNGSGNNSAIFKSTDAGETWTRISTKTSGFPTGDGVGRIGLAVYDESTIYAIHDSQFRRPENKMKEETKALKKEDFKTMTELQFLALENKKLNEFLKTNGFQKKYNAENVKQMVKSGKVKPIDLATYLENANSLLFDTPVIGAEVYKSIDGGTNWEKTHIGYLDDLYYSYGYYFGHIHVAPNNKDNIYVYGVPILKSKDGGKTFSSISAENVHADHHALWINPKNPNHLINGNDGGVNITYDDGENWIKNNAPAVGQFYAIAVDNAKPYNVYGGLQDNGVWKGPHNAKENKRWHQTGHYPWKSIMGGDGMQIEVDSRDNTIVYTGFQFGNYYRLDLEKEKEESIKPKHELGEPPYRFNWQTPIHLSRHNENTLYFGSNKLLRSLNKGKDWTAISNDLTRGGKKGNVAYGTITSISESPLKFGVIYVGTDDGLVQLTKDGGKNWINISKNLPQNLWVSRVTSSMHKKGRVYLTLNGYRWDNLQTYVFKSENYGKTWTSITRTIPRSPANVIKEDYVNENLLYLGTDNGAYVSFDAGESWEAFSKNFPAVAVHDIVLQEQSNDLLIGTHGRSIYKTNIEPLQKMSASLMKKPVTLFKLEKIKHSKRWGNSRNKWMNPNEPKTGIKLFSKTSSLLKIKILSEKKSMVNTLQIDADKGFNYIDYDLTITEKGRNALLKEDANIDIIKAKNGNYYLPKGRYTISVNGETKPLAID